MKYHDMRIRIPHSLYKNFKVVCTQKDLSIPKQTTELIKKFVEIQEEDNERMGHIKKEKI